MISSKVMGILVGEYTGQLYVFFFEQTIMTIPIKQPVMESKMGLDSWLIWV